MQTESAAALPADLHPNVTAAASSAVAPNYNHVLITDGWKLKTSLLAARARYARLTWFHSDHFSSLRHTPLPNYTISNSWYIQVFPVRAQQCIAALQVSDPNLTDVL